MGKDGGFLTPKAIANRIKAKGLQKLRWYCQMCQKQCRDENGFKCHTMSESHQRQLLIFAENTQQFMSTFSQEFKDGYLTLLKQRFGTKRVHANQVYQEYIADRQHVHMNATEWETLTDFVKWLGREGLCTVDDTEKGWFVQYIDRDPETIRRQEAIKSKEKLAMDDEERSAKFIQEQVKRASQKEGGSSSSITYTELQRTDDEEKVTFRLPIVPKAEGDSSASKPPVENPLEAAAKSKAASLEREKKPSSSSGQGLSSKRKSALDEIIEAEERRKVKVQRTDYWLAVGIVVKIITKKLGDKYYKQKGVVVEVIDKYGAIVKLVESGEKVKLDQTHLETVIPAVGKRVMVLNGAYRGCSAVMLGLNEADFSCSIKIASGPYHGKVVEMPYEDLSKLHQDES